MDYSECFNGLARYSVVGFGLFGAASLLFGKRASRFNWMLFGTGIGAGYGAYACTPNLFNAAPDVDFIRLYTSAAELFASNEPTPEQPKEEVEKPESSSN
jgi:hypothetical protein